ncbi:MAG: DUF2092 domain-containing protein [Planctomycetota bacterium]
MTGAPVGSRAKSLRCARPALAASFLVAALSPTPLPQTTMLWAPGPPTASSAVALVPAAAQDSESSINANPTKGQTFMSAEKTDDPRVFVLTQPLKSDGIRVAISTGAKRGELKWLERGRDFGYDPEAGKIFLLRDLDFDRDSQHLVASGTPRDTGIFTFHEPVTPGSVRVVLDDRLLDEGKGFEVDYGKGIVRVLDPRIQSPAAQFYVTAGVAGATRCYLNRSDVDEVQRILKEGRSKQKVQDQQEQQEEQAPSAAVFEDDPAAHALYDEMVETMRQAESLTWVSDYRWEAEGRELGHATYKIWLKKPNFARMEATAANTGELTGVLVGDGEHFWIYWPHGKPRYQFEQSGKYAEEYEKHKDSFYMQKWTPVGAHSIGHEAGQLGAGIAMTILDPSTFHGYTDSLQPYIDGVQGMGRETVDGEECDVIEVSIMHHQRSWYLWLSRDDGLPRKLKQIVRVHHDIVAYETWSDVTLDAEIPADKFVWAAPEGWKEWRMPEIEEGLLEAGAQAPDFELTSIDGSKIKLSAFRGNVVWLNKWRCG